MADAVRNNKLWLSLSETELLSSLLSVVNNAQQLADEGATLADPNESTRARYQFHIDTCKTVQQIISHVTAAYSQDGAHPDIVSLEHDTVETLRLGLRLFAALELLDHDTEGVSQTSFAALLDKTDHFLSRSDNSDKNTDEDSSPVLALSSQPPNEMTPSDVPAPQSAFVEQDPRPMTLQRSTPSLNLLSPEPPTASGNTVIQDVDSSHSLSAPGAATGSLITVSDEESGPATPPRLRRSLSAILEVDEMPSTQRHNYNMLPSFAFQSPSFNLGNPADVQSPANSFNQSLLEESNNSPHCFAPGFPPVLVAPRFPPVLATPRFPPAPATPGIPQVPAAPGFPAVPVAPGSPAVSEEEWTNYTYARPPTSSHDSPSPPAHGGFSLPFHHGSSSPDHGSSSPPAHRCYRRLEIESSSDEASDSGSQSEAGSDSPLVQAGAGSNNTESARQLRRRLRSEARTRRRREREERNAPIRLELERRSQERRESERIIIHDPAFVEYIRIRNEEYSRRQNNGSL